MKKGLLLLIVVFNISGCSSISTSEYIKKEIKVDISKCNIIVDNNEHSGFLGDGEYYVKAECLDEEKNLTKQVSSWNKLPLSENLQLIMYGGHKDGIEYGYELAKKLDIPEIKNGYYFFIDRHSESKDKFNDENIFDRYSFNFTLAMYDSDFNVFYYYEFDT